MTAVRVFTVPVRVLSGKILSVICCVRGNFEPRPQIRFWYRVLFNCSSEASPIISEGKQVSFLGATKAL